MSKQDLLDKWLLINTELHNALEELKVLDAEREQLNISVQNAKAITPKASKQMNDSIKKYKDLLTKVQTLKQQSQQLKDKLK